MLVWASMSADVRLVLSMHGFRPCFLFAAEPGSGFRCERHCSRGAGAQGVNAADRKGNNLKALKDVDLKAEAIIRP